MSCLLRDTPYLLHWVAYAVPLDLPFHGSNKVDSQLVPEHEQVDLNVCRLIGDLGTLRAPYLKRFLLGKPLKMLREFGDLDEERHREVFRGVEFPPIALACKRP